MRLISLLCFLLVSAFASAAEVTELTLWQGFKFSEVAMLRRNVDAFVQQWNTSHPGDRIAIRVEQVPFDDMTRKVKLAAPAKLLPDLFFADANRMASLVYGGVVRALDKLPNSPMADIEAARAQYVPGAFDTNRVLLRGETHLYGLPAQTTSLALFWNKAMFRARATELQAAGLLSDRAPRDWDQFVAVAKILTQPDRGVYGFGMNNSLWFTMPFFNQYGVEFVTRAADGKLESAVASPRGIAALTRKADLYLKHKVEGGAWREGNLNPDQGFQNQKYAMILTGPWMIENFRSSGLDFGVALIPGVPLEEARALGLVPADATPDSHPPETRSAGNIGGQNLVVSTTCLRPDVAVAFATYFTGTEVQRMWAQELGQIPTRIEAQQGTDLSKFPEVPLFIQQVNLAKPLPALPFGGMLEIEIFNPEMNLALQGKQSPEQALRSAEKSMRTRILDRVNEAESETPK